MPESRTRLVLLRHGQTQWNVTGQFQGQADIPLNEVGRRQASLVAPVMAALGPASIYSSDLQRAAATAAPVAEVTGLHVVFDRRLREINVGSWEGLTRELMAEADPEFLPALRAGHDHRRSPTGETAHEVGSRMRDALAEIAERHHGQTTLVATHGLALRMGAGYLLGYDYASSWRLGPMDNCGWTILGHRTDGWHLECYNRVVASVPAAEHRLPASKLHGAAALG